MQVYIEGQHTDIQPELREKITQRLEELNAQHEDIVHARVALRKNTHHSRGSMRCGSPYRYPARC